MDIALAVIGIVVGVVALAIGFVGCVLPVLPGPPVAFLALVSLQVTGVGDYGWPTLLVLGGLSAALWALDNVAAVWGVKRLGGSKAGLVGGAVGVVAGLFLFPPWGIIVGPLVGAVAGELLAGRALGRALRSGAGTLVGYLGGALAKTVLVAVVAGFFAWGVVRWLGGG